MSMLSIIILSIGLLPLLSCAPLNQPIVPAAAINQSPNEETLIAFDCAAPSYDKTYSIVGHSPCQQVDVAALIRRDTNATLIQMPVFKMLPSRYCALSIRAHHFYCSIMRDASMKLSPNNFLDTKNVHLTAAQCEDMWTTKSYSINGVEYKLNRNDVNVFVIGDDVNKEGFCSTWSKTISVELVKVTLQTTKLVAHLNPVGDIISLKGLDDGSLNNLGVGHATGLDNTVYLWDEVEAASCHWELLYQGAAVEITDTAHTKIIMVPKMTIAASVQHTTIVCGLKLESTSDPFVYYINHLQTPHIKFQALATGRWSSAINSLAQFILTSMDQRSEDQGLLLADAFCKLEQSVNLNLLMDQTSSPAERGFKFMGERGWTIERVGEAIIVSKCKEVPYIFNETNKCYDAIPINVAGSHGRSFLNPLTREIAHSANILPCDSLILPRIRVRGVWYIMNPNLIKDNTPADLPSRLNSLKSTLLVQAKGIYPHELSSEPKASTYYYKSKEEALNSLLHLSNSELGDPDTDAWQPSGRLHSLMASIWTWKHTASLASLTLAVIASVILHLTLVWWLYAKINAIAKRIPKTGDTVPLLLQPYPNQVFATSSTTPGVGNRLVAVPPP